MGANLLGRTNQAFPPVWISLSTPAQPSHPPQDLAAAATEASTVIDISSNPGLWGGMMRGTEALIMCVGNHDIEQATDETHATDLVQAHLIQVLSSLGREHLDFYFLPIRSALEEFQINGALAALEMARQEGHIRYLGVSSQGPALATLGMWQFHDAFDVLLVPRNHYDDSNYKTLAPLAQERRVGVVTSQPLNWGYGIPFTKLPSQWKLRNLTQSFYGLTLGQAVIGELAERHPVLVGVQTPEEISMAIEAPAKARPEGLDAMLSPFREAFENDEEWHALLETDDLELREAAERRRRGMARLQ